MDAPLTDARGPREPRDGPPTDHPAAVSPDESGLRRELERLRAENARLSRLLELRGQDTVPAPEQLSAAVAAPGSVTMSSPVEDKLALYADRFRARTDVYAVRWENARTGGHGWMPAVAGGWRKGMDRKGAAYLPLTADVLGAHLVGDVFVGLYPLSTDNTCHFLAADFDGPAAMLDALAYCKAARARGVPAAVEISQSGRGAHVWVFFTSPIPAAVARGVGTALIHEAMVLRGSMDLRSYDRLFPNQDVLPEGGFGNLIAAPLQGRRRKDGLTVFLDLATLEPYEDQWAFLSTLDRLTPGDAERIARHAKNTAVGTDVAAMSRSAATRVHPPLPAVVHAEVGAGLSLDSSQLTAAALATFKHAASMANPKFYELQRLRKSTWDTPRFIRGYDVTIDDRLVLPRGLRHAIAGIVERAGSRLAVTDLQKPRPRDRRRVHGRTHHQAECRGQRTARARRRCARRPAGIGQDRHGLCRDRRTRHLDPGARRPQSPGRTMAHPHRTVPGHPTRPDRRRPAQAQRRRRRRDAALPGQARRHRRPHQRVRAGHRRRVPSPRGRRVRALGQTDRRAVLARAHRDTDPT